MDGAQRPPWGRVPATSPMSLTWDETTALTPEPTLVSVLPGRSWLPRWVTTRGAKVSRAEGRTVPVNARTDGTPINSVSFPLS